MKLIDFYPLAGMLQPGQALRLALETDSESTAEIMAQVTITHLADVVEIIRKRIVVLPGLARHELLWQPPVLAPRGYGLTLQLTDQAGARLAEATTAVDVLQDWTDYPRYGFLTDFTPDRADAQQTADRLVRYHINGLQFYDWQYRHDSLLPPVDEFVDPLGRFLSLPTVRSLLDAAHQAGMAGMPYLAVYAASLEYAQAHPEQALYDKSGQPLTFEGFLGIMNPTAGSAWADHLLAECANVLAALPFDGLHVDQYGEPKTADDSHGEAVDLPKAFVDFMVTLKSANLDKAAVFNAVGNWPIDELAVGPQDFLYIEIWPPAIGYRDVWDTVSEARRKSGDKPVVIALYLPAANEANVRLADAIILSAGGTRIEIGEQDRLLSDPYFPKHEAMSAALQGDLRRYMDFAVRYGEWLGPGAADLDSSAISVQDGVWAIPRRTANWQIVSLINTTGVGDSPHWDVKHDAPEPLTNVEVIVPVSAAVSNVFWASPDGSNPQLQPVTWQQSGQQVSILLPCLETWSLVALQHESTA